MTLLRVRNVPTWGAGGFDVIMEAVRPPVCENAGLFLIQGHTNVAGSLPYPGGPSHGPWGPPFGNGAFVYRNAADEESVFVYTRGFGCTVQSGLDHLLYHYRSSFGRELKQSESLFNTLSTYQGRYQTGLSGSDPSMLQS
jgi:hypothetical protein